jgi:FkbM family methyltransferase
MSRHRGTRALRWLARLDPAVRRAERRARHTTYAHMGEDLIARHYLGRSHDGFYVDVGAHHPVHLSNTWLLYRRGWRGINLDPTPGSMRAFRRIRPFDINLELAIGAIAGTACFHLFEDPSLNTFSAELAQQHAKRSRLREIVMVQQLPLAQVLAEHVPQGRAIDFLSVDVEGLDLEVLRSNDWERHRPAVIMVEDLEARDLIAAAGSELARFLAQQGYRPLAKTAINLVFGREDSSTQSSGTPTAPPP